MNKLWNFIERMIRTILVRILKLNIDETKMESIFQFFKFGIVGLSNTVISYVIYVVALLALQQGKIFPQTDYLIAQVIAFILSVLWSFYWNNKYVFTIEENEQRSFWGALLKTYISYAFTGLFLNSVLSFIWVEALQIPKLIAPIINLLVSVPINFLMNKFWAFKKK